MFHVVAAMAEFERELIRERVRAGLANARAKGKRLGRRRVSVDSASVARLRAEDLCQEDANVSCCSRDDGGPIEIAL